MSKSKMWIVAAPIAGVLVLLIGWFSLVSGTRANADELRIQAEQTTANNVATQAQLDTLKKQALTLPAEKAKLAAIRLKIPMTPEQRALTVRLSSLATSTGVNLKSITFTPPTTGTATTTAGSTGATPLPVTMQASGTYAQIKLFMSGMETMPRAYLVGLITLSKVSSTTGTAGAVTSGSPDVSVTITGQTFMAPTFSATSTTVTGTTTTGSAN